MGNSEIKFPFSKSGDENPSKLLPFDGISVLSLNMEVNGKWKHLYFEIKEEGKVETSRSEGKTLPQGDDLRFSKNNYNVKLNKDEFN